MPEWAQSVITWEQAREYIDGGTVESLGKLRRSEAQLTGYRAAMDKVRRDYASVTDYIKITVLERTSRVNGEGKKEAVDGEHGVDHLVWHLNDFPYFFEPDVRHWLLWHTAGPLDRGAIERAVASRFPDAEHEHLVFVNPAALQSVLTIWHCHVLVRPRRAEPAA